MKVRKVFQKIRAAWKRIDQRGQTLMEFVLLLVVVSTISFMFVAFMNRSLVKYWQYAVNLVITDKPGETQVTLQ